MAKVNKCTEKLLGFFTAVFNDDWKKAEQCQNKIAALEKDADIMKREVRSHLPKGMFLPVSRSDLLELLTAQDNIANKAEDIAGLILGRKMHFPKEMIAQMQEFLKRSVDASTQAAKAISELDDLLEAGFRGSEVAVVEKMLNKLDEIETETDDLQKEVRSGLFALEKDMAPVEVMFLYKIIEWIGDLADRAQHVGGKLQLLIAK